MRKWMQTEAGIILVMHMYYRLKLCLVRFQVRLHDLHSPGRRKLNGELGLVRCFSTATGRYTVELSDGASGCLGLQRGES